MFSIYIIALYAALLVLRPTRKLALALTPWLVFACSYDWMRLLPNYEVNPIGTESARQIPSEYFAQHHCGIADFMAGLFYLCWVPVPLGFAIYLYLKGDKKSYLRFSLAFLFVNLLGFCGYYIHPAAPPWYAMNYGFEPVLNTPGNVAGLGRFDAMTGLGIFHGLYGKNANVFAAVPSLHAAYMLIATIYAVVSRQRKTTVVLFAFICLGIWWTAVYSSHHYIIDVMLGIATTIVGIVLLEKVLLRLPTLQKGLQSYIAHI